VTVTEQSIRSNMNVEIVGHVRIPIIVINSVHDAYVLRKWFCNVFHKWPQKAHSR